MMSTITKVVVWLILSVCMIGLPFSFVAFGSDLNTRKSTLYPYQSSMFLSDEFLIGGTGSGTTGAMGWSTSGTITNIGGEINRPGILRIDTGAVINTIARINYANANDSAPQQSNLLFIARLNTNDANTKVRIGSSNSGTANPPNEGIYFEKLDADTNWFCVTRTGAVETRTDSGVAVSTSFTTFNYIRRGSTVEFRLNNAIVCTHTTNITSVNMLGWIFIINSAAASKTIDIDYWQHIITGLVR